MIRGFKRCFNSKLVRLKANPKYLRKKMRCFNSKLVRLKSDHIVRAEQEDIDVSIPNWFD